MIEPCVIGLGEGNDKFTRPLITAIDSHSCTSEPRGVHQRDELEEQIGLRLKQIGRFTFDRSFELLCIFAGNPIPRFRLAPVH